jgi:hypothetical protein
MDQQFAGLPDSQTHDSPESPESVLIGAPIQTRPDLVKAINPITYISPSASPFLIQHGTADRLVPPQQSQIFYDALKPVLGEDKVRLTLLQDAPHGGGPQFWDPANVKLVMAFLDRYLKKEPRKINKVYQASTSANMSNGPRLYSFRDDLHLYGAYKNITFAEKDHGKTARIEVDTNHRPVCWIEIWRGQYDGDWVKWSAERGRAPVAKSSDQPQADPSLTWIIEAGSYTIYFVTSSRTNDVGNESIMYEIKTD